MIRSLRIIIPPHPLPPSPPPHTTAQKIHCKNQGSWHFSCSNHSRKQLSNYALHTGPFEHFVPLDTGTPRAQLKALMSCSAERRMSTLELLSTLAYREHPEKRSISGTYGSIFASLLSVRYLAFSPRFANQRPTNKNDEHDRRRKQIVQHAEIPIFASLLSVR